MRRRCFFFAYTKPGSRSKKNQYAHCPLKAHGIFVMKDFETARQGAQNLTTRTSVKTPRSTMRTLHEAVEDQHFDWNDWWLAIFNQSTRNPGCRFYGISL